MSDIGLTGDAAEVERLRAELDRKSEEIAELWARLEARRAQVDRMAEVERLRARDPNTIYHEHEKLRQAIVAHRERWTSVNSGDIKQNARPADLELWEVLDA